ncbi:MAG TPA: hypothetical protein VM733_03710 [Thermoanaerobaculia bacterium]|nr:hypothetical protein [Thermoanaerobaculia bacterium]
MKRLSVLSVLVAWSVLFAADVNAQCFSGRAYVGASSGTYYAGNFNMKWCKADDRDYRPTSQCVSGTTNSVGDFNINVSYYGYGYYYAYLWKDDVYWGQENYPASTAIIANTPVPYCNYQSSLYTYPRALPPGAVYPPNNSVNIPTSFTLRWSDGLDADRTGWPVTYDIYSSGNDTPESLVFSDLPCNGSGTCSVGITGLSYTSRFQWRVVAKMKSGYVIPAAGQDNRSATSSATFHFATTWNPSIPVRNFRTDNGRLLKAVSGGGFNGAAGTFDATGTTSTYETQFQFVPLNGGTIYSGDQIYIKTNRNYFVSAIGCGNSGVNTTGWAMNYELWTIVRLDGFGPVGTGDRVAFRSGCGYYMSAAGGGGSSVSATAFSPGTWETFVVQ